MQFGEYAQALEPASLRKQILDAVKNIREKYRKDKINSK
jgi:predicted DNA-binding transcriptional regulator YafY